MQKKRYFFRTDDNGALVAWLIDWVNDDFKSTFTPLEVTSPEEIRLLESRPRDLLLHNGVLSLKPVVGFTLDKSSIRGDGKDVAVLRVRDLPEWLSEIDVYIGDHKTKMGASESLEITCDTPQAIHIYSLDSRIRCEHAYLKVIP